jgi:hypothetical protein
MVLRRIFGPERDEVTGEWRRLHNKELHALYSSPNFTSGVISRRTRWVGQVARVGDRRDDGKRPLGRPRRRWEDTIKIDI